MALLRCIFKLQNARLLLLSFVTSVVKSDVLFPLRPSRPGVYPERQQMGGKCPILSACIHTNPR